VSELVLLRLLCGAEFGSEFVVCECKNCVLFVSGCLELWNFGFAGQEWRGDGWRIRVAELGLRERDVD
jgi:hypothetical protein